MVRKGRRKEFGKFTKKIAAVGLALAMTVSTAIPTYAYLWIFRRVYQK